MEHSIQSYLRRQPTELLKALLVTYEETDDELGVAEIIRAILAERSKNA